MLQKGCGAELVTSVMTFVWLTILLTIFFFPKQILIFRLLAGRTIELGADPALLLPPSVPQENNNFVSKRFDTVIGHHPSGHQIFAVYSNERSYPEYLIT